jgi:hypothetical protein
MFHIILILYLRKYENSLTFDAWFINKYEHINAHIFRLSENN